MPEEQILRLPDAFVNRQKEADVELKVRMLNINYGHQKELMERCKVLREYAEFVDVVRHYARIGTTLQEALDVDKYERTLRAEGREEGMQQVARINQLTCVLLEQNRIADLKRATVESEYQEQLLKELNL